MTQRDRLRELLDAVLAPEHAGLQTMAAAAFASPYDFSRKVSRATGEPPVAMRRRVLLERAAWELRRGASVTEAAIAAGYDSVDGFSRAFARAFGTTPSRLDGTGASWLPAPNGVHFHPPTSLWIDAKEHMMSHAHAVSELMVRHDLDDTGALLKAATGLSAADWNRPQLDGHVVLEFDGAETSVGDVLRRTVFTKQIWLAAIAGEDFPPDPPADAADVLALHERVAPRWLATVRDLDQRDAWDDVLIDALCDPPESFVIGSVLAHVLHFASYRRMLARHLLRGLGASVDDGDPISWLRRESGQDAG